MPSETGRPSLKFLAGLWQFAHDTAPLAENEGSTKSFLPSAAAAASSAWALVGSGGGAEGSFMSRSSSHWSR
jgi:hypothetical protein